MATTTYYQRERERERERERRERERGERDERGFFIWIKS